MLTRKELSAILEYEPTTGRFYWLWPLNNRITIGDLAGGPGVYGYWYIQIQRRTYKAHRLAWLYMTGEWPAGHLDHANGDRSDNRWGNLRAARRIDNQRNQRLKRTNTSGFKGVSARDGRWRARIRVQYRTINLGAFDTPEDAARAYDAAAVKFFGEFAATNEGLGLYAAREALCE